ncbi:amidohydrolase [Acetobacter tropicalis NRIC 0312]|uniref:Amidohydrolase-related domain-containing protein n=2 Tax=Acetobacter tropicalis TaxID=104102 RepID=A0A511FRV9_9PROT|nr:amidohydrolase [Acetobacter tropicalis]GBR70267.1 amidohydrolase [Acetobacter tropicalis NRIC 0312]GEL51682.1 hypothetical protein ATR01nite_27570 [Acetobacter tropicalis]
MQVWGAAHAYYLSGMVNYMSMISSGTTCFLEAGGPHPDEMGRAANDVGIRGIIALNTCDKDGPGGLLPKSHIRSTKACLTENEALVLRWSDHPRVNAWLSLRQILVNSEDLRVSMWHLANQLNTTIHTHLSEGTYEIDYTIDNYNLRPPAYLKKLGIFDHRMHLGHSAMLNDHDLQLYMESNVSASHCAYQDYFISPHRFYEMVTGGVMVGLGTGSSASRGNSDLFQVAHYAVLGQAIEYGTPFLAGMPIDYKDMLKFAIGNGARAARLEHKIGSLEVGKCADIVLCESDSIDNFFCDDELHALSSMTTGRNVKTVIVDGNIIMENRKFLTVDEECIKSRSKILYRKLQNKFSEISSI